MKTNDPTYLGGDCFANLTAREARDARRACRFFGQEHLITAILARPAEAARIVDLWRLATRGQAVPS